MNWVNEVRLRQKRKNQILFGKDSECLQDLIALLHGQDHRTIALWAFDFADESIALLEKNIGLPCLCKGNRQQGGYRNLPCDLASVCGCSYNGTCNRVSDL